MLERDAEKNDGALKRQSSYFVFYVLLFICVSQSGIAKYFVLSALTVFFFVMRPVPVKYFLVILHSMVYVIAGVATACVKGNFVYESIKQILIYMSCGFFAIGVFSFYGKKQSEELIDCQFFGLLAAYVIMFAKYFTPEEFFYESSLYAYIFGAYALLYFYRGSYFKMLLAVAFMIFDHKRITDAATVFCVLCLILIWLCGKIRLRRIINFAGCIVLAVFPLVWIYLCRAGIAERIFDALNINTMGRVNMWRKMNDYYVFSPDFTGWGIGWVSEWLKNANIPSFSNLHNDFLMAYIELGFWGYVLWILSFVLIVALVKKESVKKANFIMILFGYAFINFLTDNIYLYVSFLTPLYTICLDVIYGENENPTYEKLY